MEGKIKRLFQKAGKRSSSVSSPPTVHTTYRIIVMGAAKVGKTCILNRLIYGKYKDEHSPTVEDLYHKSFRLEEQTINLDFLDTSGTFSFPAMKQLAIANGDAFILVFALDDIGTFKNVMRCKDEIFEEKRTPKVPVIVIGNKADMETKNRGSELEIVESTVSIDWEIPYMEVSAKDNLNVSGIFKKIFTALKVDLVNMKNRRFSFPGIYRRKASKVFD